MHPKISVIIPVYNVKEYIHACIDSILAQRFTDFELILVDDCSTDGSARIIDEYRTQDDRIRIIRLDENSGQGYARNVGIDSAMGEYLSFIDSDDIIAPDFFELLYKRAVESGAEIVKGLGCVVHKDSSIKDTDKHTFKEVNHAIRQYLIGKSPRPFCFYAEHWSAIYKRDFLNEHGIRYGLSRLSQDTTFLLKVAAYMENIELVDEAVYYYIQRGDSIIHSYGTKRFYALLLALEERIDFVNTGAAKPSVFLSLIRQTMNNLLAHQAYLSVRIPEAESSAMLARLYDIALKYRYMSETTEQDYSLKAFMASKGLANICLNGRIVGHEDNTEWMLISLDKFVDYINEDDANPGHGLKYLSDATANMYYNAFVDHPNASPEMYREFSEKLRAILMRFKYLDELCRQMLLCDCLIKYGVDIFFHSFRKYSDANLNSAYKIVDQLSRINALLDEHPNARKYVKLGNMLADKGFAVLKGVRSTDKKTVDLLMTMLVSEVEKLYARSITDKN